MSLRIIADASLAAGTNDTASRDTVTVRNGDTLSAIAARNHVPLADLLAANPRITDPNKIFPGQDVKLPQPVLAGAPRADAETVLDGVKPLAQPLVTAAGAVAKAQLAAVMGQRTIGGLNNLQLRAVPPGGTVPGIYAQIDGASSVSKAPVGTEAALSGLKDGRDTVGAGNVSALPRTPEVVKHREGGDPSTSFKSPGRTEYDAITLERGVTHDPEFEQWAGKVTSSGAGLGSEVSLRNFRKDTFIEIYN